MPFTSILATIFPLSPGFRRLELAITAVHPQDGTMSSILRSSVPAFVNSKVCSIIPSNTSPKLYFSESNFMEGCEKQIAGKESKNIIKKKYFIIYIL